MRAFTYTWSIPAMWQRWQSHHLINLNLKPHATCKPHGLFYRTRIMAIQSVTLWKKYKSTFCSCDLTLTRWPSNTKLTCIPWRYTACVKVNFILQGFRKLSYNSLRIYAVMRGRSDHLRKISSHYWICHTRKPHATCKPYGFVFIEPQSTVIANQNLTIRNIGIFDLYAPVTLTLTRLPSYTNLTSIR